MDLLSVDKLSLSIGGAPVLKDVSLNIAPGETLGLVGESGSGKSMTALAIMQLLPTGSRTSGAIRFAQNDLSTYSEKQMCKLRGREIGMVFQEPMTALNPVKTIGEQVAEGIRFHLRLSKSKAWERACDILDRVGLPPDKYAPSRFPHQLSGGQRQRVVIAIAVALRPKLLVADEPTTALDVTIQAQILELLRDLVRDNDMGLLLITHDLAVVADMADRIAIMRHGEIVEHDETVQLFRHMRHPYSRQLLEASSHVPTHTKPPVYSDDMAGGEPVVRVQSLVRDYVLPRRSLFQRPPRHRAVNNVSFDIYPGQSIGLVGESGCGKSTLARTLLALDSPDGGGIRVMGTDPFSLAHADLYKLRRNMQVVFQDPYGSFNPRHKVARLIAEPLHLLGRELAPRERAERVAKALSDVGLSPADADKFPHEFSGGQRQRLAIARALITEPRLIVADEPVSALDVSIRAQILDLFAQLRDRLGLSYLFISHDLSVVRAITDEVLVMYEGQIVERGATARVLSEPAHDYTRTLINAAPDLERARARRAAGQ
jgi:peptide/nickel transport system ATP-binding protein